MKDARLIKIVVEEKTLIKLLITLGDKNGYATRKLLTKFGGYGHGHRLLLKASKMGLVERKFVKNRTLNSLTSEGKKLVMIAKEIGV